MATIDPERLWLQLPRAACELIAAYVTWAKFPVCEQTALDMVRASAHARFMFNVRYDQGDVLVSAAFQGAIQEALGID